MRESLRPQKRIPEDLIRKNGLKKTKDNLAQDSDQFYFDPEHHKDSVSRVQNDSMGKLAGGLEKNSDEFYFDPSFHSQPTEEIQNLGNVLMSIEPNSKNWEKKKEERKETNQKEKKRRESQGKSEMKKERENKMKIEKKKNKEEKKKEDGKNKRKSKKDRLSANERENERAIDQANEINRPHQDGRNKGNQNKRTSSLGTRSPKRDAAPPRPQSSEINRGKLSFIQRSLIKRTKLSIERLPFSRFIRKVTNDTVMQTQEGNREYKWSSHALSILQAQAEVLMVREFENANMCANHAKRVTVMPKDFELAQKVQMKD